MEETPNKQKAGFIAILGAPNAGKSTLLNNMVGQKISITSKKPQTTRNRILGLVTRSNCQYIFIDTPGIHRVKGALNAKIVDAALSSIGDADVILFIADAFRSDLRSENILLTRLNNINKPVICALNKIDIIEKTPLLFLIEKHSKDHSFKSIIPISAKHGTGVDILFSEIEKFMPESPMLFPEDAVTDVSQRFIAAEIIREKVFRYTGEEIPYAVAVTIESFKETSKIDKIDATIHVEKKSQKGIIIGKKGSKLVQIGTAARKEIEEMTGKRAYLKLFVHVEKNWSNNAKALLEFGYL
ncbi:MAG: GTPase Era [Deltaproteobacteria bacterium]|nr:GTPase Era [Deltaproteobacteria bacterium]